MAIVNKVEQKAKVGINDVIQYQILTYCFFNKIQIGTSDLKCLTELAKADGIELTLFCGEMVTKKIFKSSQSARNFITKGERKDLIVKNGINKKTISLNKKLNVQTKGTIFLDFKILGVES
jgi:hypothetical protein